MTKRQAEMIKDLEAFVKDAQGQRTRRVRTVKLEAVLSTSEFKEARKELFHATQEEMAQVLGVSPETVRAWEQGKSPITALVSRMIRLAQKRPKLIVNDLRLLAHV